MARDERHPLGIDTEYVDDLAAGMDLATARLKLGVRLGERLRTLKNDNEVIRLTETMPGEAARAYAAHQALARARQRPGATYGTTPSTGRR